MEAISPFINLAMIRIITFGNTKIWLFIQQLHQHNNGDLINPVPLNKFICYFKFSEPTVILFGELMRNDETGIPFMFNSAEEAEKFAAEFLHKKYNFNI